MINAGNPSAHNLKIRKYMTENKQTSAQIFEKLNRRGRLNPAQNAMSAQLTNEQLLRFYIKETAPKLEFNNDNIQGQGGDANSVLMSEIQRLIDVGNFNAEDAKGNMNNMQTKLVTELQRGFSSVDDSVAINLSSVRDILYGVEDSLNEYLVKGGGGGSGVGAAAPIITALQDISTKLDQYNTTGNISQSALLSSLTDLQNALLTANVNSADNTAAIEQLQIIMGSIPGIAVPSSSSASGGSTVPSSPSPAQTAAAQALLTAQTAQAAAAAAAKKAINDAATAAAAGPPPSPSAASGPPPSPSAAAAAGAGAAAAGALSGIAGGVASLFGYGTKPPPPPIIIPGTSGVSTILAPVSPTGGMGAAGGVITGEHPEITAAKVAAGTKRDLTITQNKELLLNLYNEYPEIFATELSSIKTADPFKTWISKPDKDKSTTKNLVYELLAKKNELLTARAEKAVQDAEDWRLKKIRIMKQTRDEIDSGFAPKAAAYEKAKAKAAAKKIAQDFIAKKMAEAAAEAAAEAKTNSALAKFQANLRGAAARKKLRSAGGAAGGAAPP